VLLCVSFVERPAATDRLAEPGWSIAKRSAIQALLTVVWVRELDPIHKHHITAIAPGHHVIHRASILETRLARHGEALAVSSGRGKEM